MQRFPIKKKQFQKKITIIINLNQQKLRYYWENKKHRYHTSKRDTNYNGQKQLQKKLSTKEYTEN